MSAFGNPFASTQQTPLPNPFLLGLLQGRSNQMQRGLGLALNIGGQDHYGEDRAILDQRRREAEQRAFTAQLYGQRQTEQERLLGERNMFAAGEQQKRLDAQAAQQGQAQTAMAARDVAHQKARDEFEATKRQWELDHPKALSPSAQATAEEQARQRREEQYAAEMRDPSQGGMGGVDESLAEAVQNAPSNRALKAEARGKREAATATQRATTNANAAAGLDLRREGAARNEAHFQALQTRHEADRSAAEASAARRAGASGQRLNSSLWARAYDAAVKEADQAGALSPFYGYADESQDGPHPLTDKRRSFLNQRAQETYQQYKSAPGGGGGLGGPDSGVTPFGTPDGSGAAGRWEPHGSNDPFLFGGVGGGMTVNRATPQGPNADFTALENRAATSASTAPTDSEPGRRVDYSNVRSPTKIATDLLASKHPAARKIALAEMRADPEKFRARGVDVEGVLAAYPEGSGSVGGSYQRGSSGDNSGRGGAMPGEVPDASVSNGDESMGFSAMPDRPAKILPYEGQGSIMAGSAPSPWTRREGSLSGVGTEDFIQFLKSKTPLAQREILNEIKAHPERFDKPGVDWRSVLEEFGQG